MKKILLGILTMTFFSQCHDDLDLKPISEETSEIAYESAAQLEAALVAVYDAFGGATENFYNEYYAWDKLNFQEVRSDNHYAGGDVAELFAVDLLDIQPTNSRLYWHWGALYSAIGKANNVLERAPLVQDVNLTEERRSQIMGEAYFLRAYHYYNLVNMWGGVPLVLSFTTSVEPEDIYVERSSAEDVFAQILSDLDLAIDLLPDEYGSDPGVNKARATSGAANALAAKASLQKPSPNYQEALDYILEVESSSADYRLIDYNHLFDGNHENNDESILEMQYIGGTEGNIGPQLLLPPSIAGDDWRKFMTPSQDLINAYTEAGDNVRMNASILFESVQWIDEYWGNAVGSSIPFSYKWKNAGGWASDNNTYLLRYGDIVLLKAEALLGLTRLSEAADEVDRIRLRVSLSPLDASTRSNATLLREAILKERRLELAHEGQRWDDLVRFGVAVSTMNDLVEIDLRTGEPVDYNMTEAKILLPIPQQELDRNPSLVQNPL